jgi:hexosaminidase
MHGRIFLLIVMAGAMGCAETVTKLWSRGYAVIPEPQQVEIMGDDVAFGPEWTLRRGRGVRGDDVAIEALDGELSTRFGLRRNESAKTVVTLQMNAGAVVPGKATDDDKDSIAAQAYRLEIHDSQITITANAPEGLFYGAETLVQLLRPQQGRLWLPQGTITDWPDLHLRHIYWDDAHHLDRLSELKRAVRQAAFFKINGFALKLEGHFQFGSAPALVEPYALSPAEYQELTDYGLRYHVQVIPYLDGPAHIAFILKHPEYAKYRAFPDSNYELCVVNPDAINLLSGMLQDLVNANRGGKFVYLSTDEPYYVGMAQSPSCDEKAAAREKGSAGKLLADFVAKVAGPLHARGRSVIFWGEFPLKPDDIAALPNYLINGEATGAGFNAVFRKQGIRQMIYTSTQGGISRFFPDYFSLPNSRRLHPVGSQVDRIADGFRKISYDPVRVEGSVTGAVVAGWADMGLHPETFWLGYATITAAAWRPGTPPISQAMASFYKLFYGDGAMNMDRVYQLMSQQAHFWLDSWDWGPSPRTPIWGNSEGIFKPGRPVRDQTIPLPAAPGPNLKFEASWNSENSRRLELAADSLADNDELLGLLQENLRTVALNRYNLEVYVSIAQMYRQNLEMLLDIGRMCFLLESAQRAAAENKAGEALESVDRALELARQIRQKRNITFRDAVATWYKSWFPRAAEANGRKFLHQLDDVKDHVPDRTVDMTYLIYRELQLPFGAWVESIRTARNRYAAANGRDADTATFNWLDLSDHPVVGGIPEE